MDTVSDTKPISNRKQPQDTTKCTKTENDLQAFHALIYPIMFTSSHSESNKGHQVAIGWSEALQAGIASNSYWNTIKTTMNINTLVDHYFHINACDMLLI